MGNADKIQTRRKFLSGTGGLATAAVLAGCTGDDEGQSADEIVDDDSDDTDPGDDDETYLQLVNGTMDTMDPVESTLANTAEVLDQVMDTPFVNPNGEITVENLLVEDYELADDDITYTLFLEEGVEYHGDGGDWGEVTAADFAYNWERLAASQNSRRVGNILDDLGISHETDDDGNYVPESLEVEVIDEYTIEFTLQSPYFAALDEMTHRAFAPLPEGIVGDIDGYDGEVDHDDIRNEIVVGAGPFVFESWESDQEAQVSANEDYYGDGPIVDGVHWQILEDSNAIYNYAMNRNVDMIGTHFPTAQFDPSLIDITDEENGRETGTYGPVRNDEMMDYMRVPALSSGFLLFNMREVPLAVRKAAAHVMDHSQIASDIFKDRVQPGYMMTPPSIFPGGPEAYWELVEEEYPYGPGTQIDEARKVMEEAGYGEDDPFEFSFTITDSDTNRQMAQLLRDQLTAAYVDVEIDVAPFATMIERRGEGNIDSADSGWSMSVNNPGGILQLLYPEHTLIENPNSIIEVNWDGDGSEEATEAWERAQANPSPDDESTEIREEAFIELEMLMWEHVPFICYEHRLVERMAYDWTDAPLLGPLDSQKYNQVDVGDRS